MSTPENQKHAMIYAEIINGEISRIYATLVGNDRICFSMEWIEAENYRVVFAAAEGEDLDLPRVSIPMALSYLATWATVNKITHLWTESEKNVRNLSDYMDKHKIWGIKKGRKILAFGILQKEFSKISRLNLSTGTAECIKAKADFLHGLLCGENPNHLIRRCEV